MDNLKEIVENIKLGNLDKALKLCDLNETLEDNYIINNFKGVIFSLKRKHDIAEKFFIKSHNLNKKFEDPLKNLFIIYINKKNFLEAINISKKLCEIDNNKDLYLYYLAYAYENNNNKVLAIDTYDQCIELNGQNKIKALNNAGSIYLRNNKIKTSLKYLEKANKISENDKVLINNLLLNYIKLKDESKADELLIVSENLDKNYEGFIYNKAQYYILKEKFNEAIEILKKNKSSIKFLILLIELYFNMGKFEEAELLLKENKNEIINDINFYNYFGIRSLREGNFKEGWNYYESRGSKTTGYLKNLKEWKGEKLTNKSIVVFYEQGIGDTIQFSKYVYALTKIAGKVCFVVNTGIKNLFRTDINNLIIDTRQNFIGSSFDYKISLGSLLKFFYLEKFNSHDYLINKNIDANEDWKNKLSSNKPNVGLVWTGSFLGPNQPFRSIQLKNLVKILNLDINFYCLQNEIWESDKEYFNNNKIHDFGKYDLVEISSIIKNLDLVISVDTAILHISAILNKETWGIFNIYPDWRWGALDKINPYNSLVKINQTKFNQWEDVTDKIHQKLKDKFKLN
tara:strand:+ start:335 stop:2044 length:1710 start_codon:yes stop_codon:yes gene_type:complete